MTNTVKKRGRGRPKVGKLKVVSMTFPENYWEQIDSIITSGKASSKSEYFRLLHERYMKEQK